MKPALIGKIPPQSIENECAFLGSIMLRPEAIYEVVDVISPPSFYAQKHRDIYQTMLELYNKKEPIDLLSLSNRLREKKQLESIGGNSYLTELINVVPSSVNVKHYAETIQKKYILRKLLEASDFIGELGYNEELDLGELLDQAEKKIGGISNLHSAQKISMLKQTLSEAWERIDRLHKQKEKIRGVPTGFYELDNLLSGLQKSDLIILAARPSIGKTTLALDIARQVACSHNTPVGIFSLEMSSQQLVDRILAAESKVNSWKLRTGKLSTDNEFMNIRTALDRLSKAPIFFDDTPGNTILNIRSVARKLKREHKIELIIVDYIQLIATPRSYDSMVQQVTEISRALKSLARELEIPVLALSQLSRAIEQRRDKPRLSDLRDSGSLEQDADVVMFIHRQDRYKETSEKTNIVEILVEKHRNGPVGGIKLYFDEERTTFLSIDKTRHGEEEENNDAQEEKEEGPF